MKGWVFCKKIIQFVNDGLEFLFWGEVICEQQVCIGKVYYLIECY